MNSYADIQLDGVWFSAGTIHRFSEIDPEASWRQAIVQFLEEWFNREDYLTVQTSGSTGTPKTIRLLKQSMLNSARMTCSFFDLSKDQTALLCLPVDNIAGKMMLVRAMVAGFNLLTVKPAGNPFTEVHCVVDFAAVTPFQLISSHHTLREKTIRKLIVGGSPVSQKLQKITDNLDTEIYETYGMTETCSHIALRRLNGGAPDEFFIALPGVEIGQDERKRLIINVPDIANFRIITNDVVEIPGKSQFKWIGRFDHVINSGGIKLFAEQIEKKLETIINCCFFIGSLPDDKLTEKVVLVIEGPEWSESDLAKLNKDLKTVLTPFEIPRSIHFTESFATTSSGKVLKPEILRKLNALI
ncbi:MAG: AMP-binding protein [Bacteroidales bacterium]|nr:AMP-binding protein [Bacteroidales bacterium]